MSEICFWIVPGIDFDIVVEGDAIELGKILVKNYGGRITKHNRFGTAKWNISEIKTDLIETFSNHDKYDPDNLPDSLDLISARMEFYKYPSALPSVEQGSIKLDLHRRDFTINTMAIRLDGRHYGNLYDYWGGLNDLKNGIIRVLHSLSFIDDPTRMLRAVRFEQRFKFRIESRTLELMDEAYQLLSQISGERLRHEFNLILDEENPSEMFKRFDELGLLTAIHPELKWTGNIEKILEYNSKSRDRTRMETARIIWSATNKKSPGLPCLVGEYATIICRINSPSIKIPKKFHPDNHKVGRTMAGY